MSSNDGSDSEIPIDRMATHVYDPDRPRSHQTPSPSGPPHNSSVASVPVDRQKTAPGGESAPAISDNNSTLPPPTTTGAYEEALGADEPTPPPTTTGAYEQALGIDDPTPPPTTTGAYEEALGADEPTPPPGSVATSSPGGVVQKRERSAHEAEHLSSIGFIPGSNFRTPEPGDKEPKPRSLRRKKGRSFTIAGRTFTVPTLTWLDDADGIRRAQYAGMGLVTGALLGGVLGVLNAILQGWSIAEGSGQLLALSVIFGLICAVMGAMRPSRVDRIFEKIGIDD